MFAAKCRIVPRRATLKLGAVLGTLVLGMGMSLGTAAPLVPLPPQSPGIPWPTQDWPSISPAPLPQAALAALDYELQVVAAPRPVLGETRAVVIVQGGRLVIERYMPGFGPGTRLISWSVAKSITHALVGIAVRKGLVDIDRPMGNRRWPPADPRAAVTWRQWLNMVDGQDYHEIGVADPAQNDAARMLFGVGRLDVAAFGAGLPQVHPPGTHWNYNSAGINLITDALGEVFAPGAAPAERRARVAAVLAGELFGPLGMTSAVPEFDAAGTLIGSALVYATARDFARFGLLYLRDGVWEGRRILPAGWVDFARTRNPAPNGDRYGACFWITPAVGPTRMGSTEVPEGPLDLFAAQGFEGQLIVIVPSKDLVLVRLGRLEDVQGFGALWRWVQGVVTLFPDSSARRAP